MNKNEINAAIGDIVSGIQRDDSTLTMQGLSILVGGALLDLNRVANAVEKLSKFELEQVGEILRVGRRNDGEELFTEAELETLRALRRGDITVVAHNPANAPKAPEPIGPDGFALIVKGGKRPLGTYALTRYDLANQDKRQLLLNVEIPDNSWAEELPHSEWVYWRIARP